MNKFGITNSIYQDECLNQKIHLDEIAYTQGYFRLYNGEIEIVDLRWDYNLNEEEIKQYKINREFGIIDYYKDKFFVNFRNSVAHGDFLFQEKLCTGYVSSLPAYQ